VSMGNVAASGGYWIAMNADQIFANESTITGSIGIFGLFFTVPDTLAKIGVRTDGVGTTRLAGAIDPRMPLKPMVADIVQAVIEQGYADFIGKVAKARGNSEQAIDQVARGRVWSGAQAKARGLVDQLGGLEAAIIDAATRAGLDKDDYRVRYVERELSPFERFLVQTGRSRVTAMLTERLGVAPLLLGERHLGELTRDLALLRAPESGSPFRAVAYCFCQL
jgi:protease IV